MLICKDADCTFRIWVSNLDKKGPTVTICNPHTCSLAIYYKNKNAHSVKYIIEHHRLLVINNPYITAIQIRSNERLNFNNENSYRQAYRTIQAILAKMYGNKAKSFAKFPAYTEHFKAADPTNYCKIQVYRETGYFLGAFFAPNRLQHAAKCI